MARALGDAVREMEVRLEKLERRRSRADKRPLHIAYASLVVGVASGAIGIVNAMAINDLSVRMQKTTPVALTPTPKAEAPKGPITKQPTTRTWGECGRVGGIYYCR
jgi:hypothetical protein